MWGASSLKKKLLTLKVRLRKIHSYFSHQWDIIDKINGYDFYWKDSINKGSVFIYVRKNFKVTEIIIKQQIEGIKEL